MCHEQGKSFSMDNSRAPWRVQALPAEAASLQGPRTYVLTSS